MSDTAETTALARAGRTVHDTNGFGTQRANRSAPHA
ncbi:hypothetical protein SSPS47_16035 [Streptomyces sp. S4.7]|nr:hypothetical protein SSPS47_16035 [Streptomyces sp. S4.7]